MNGLKLVLITLVFVNFEFNVITQKTILNTPGCRIADYEMKYLKMRQNLSCAKRFVVVNKINDNQIIFTTLRKFDSCIYSFIEMSNSINKRYRFTPFKPFSNNTIAILTNDFVHVVCKENGEVSYVDSYAMIKPINKEAEKPKEHNKASSYNVLMIGLDTIPRKRAYDSLQKTVGFLNKNNWLDFRGFNKIGENTIPNLMAMLSGNFLYGNPTCLQEMSACNHKLLWHSFQERGYVTAYGEDGAVLPSTFNYFGTGFSSPPTNHYMEPFFKSSEKSYGCLFCTGHQFSGLQVLNYILDYVATYRTKKYFGFFFINSFSHGIYQSPKYYDDIVMQFFSTLKDLGVYNNTFVILFSDHGIRYGPVRVAFQSFIDERLPMLFMHVPDDFKISAEYDNLLVNQHRLISPYDLYLTVWDILKTSTDETLNQKAEDCPQCMSLFRQIPDDRTCSDAGISEKWCACFVNSSDTNLGEFETIYSVVKTMNYLKKLPLHIPTVPCTKCVQMSIKNLLRLHSLVDHNGTKFYVLAFVVNPNQATYEVTVRKSVNRTGNTFSYDVVRFHLISQYDGKAGWCTVEPDRDETLCVCKNINFCFDVK